MARWVGQYLDLYSTENSVSRKALDTIEDLPVLEELDTNPTIEELNKAIDALSSGKAPGEDGIPPEIIRCGKPALLKPLHEVLCTCWNECKVPQDMSDAKIITLYKNKGDRSDCNNYRGISLPSVVGYVIARVVRTRLQVFAKRIYPESQCGFRAERLTVDMVFAVRQLQEKCREQQIHRLYRPYQRLKACEQERSVPAHEEERLPPLPPPHSPRSYSASLPLFVTTFREQSAMTVHHQSLLRS